MKRWVFQRVCRKDVDDDDNDNDNDGHLHSALSPATAGGTKRL